MGNKSEELEEEVKEVFRYDTVLKNPIKVKLLGDKTIGETGYVQILLHDNTKGETSQKPAVKRNSTNKAVVEPGKAIQKQRETTTNKNKEAETEVSKEPKQNGKRGRPRKEEIEK